MTGYLKLPLAFDVPRMRQELDAIGTEAWIGHFNTGDYEGGWRCVPLRSVDGRADNILPIEGARYADTAWLERCPYLREVIDSFQCEKTSVRLMSLEPGALIREHRDPGTALEQGVTRVHVPIATTPDTIFRIEGEVVHFAAGHAWYLNASCLHGVENRSAAARVHLMLDCVTNPWLEAMFVAAGGEKREPLSADELALLRGRLVPYEGDLRGWFPVTFGPGAGSAPAIGWRFLGERPLTAAFFHDSLAGQPSGERRVCHTPQAALDAFGDSVAPSAFVFHVSRCGSTLLTQCVATLPQCVVLSEPPVLDAFLRFHHRYPQRSGGTDTLRKLVAALAQRRSGRERHCVVKMDSWHAPWVGFLREAFPDTPFVFLYRDPREVLASHMRQRGRQMVPGLLDTSLLRPQVADLPPGDLDTYATRVLDAVYGAGLDAADAGLGLELVNYTQLPQALFDALMPRWGIDGSDEELAAARARAQFDAKHPTRRFESDAAPTEKGGAASSNEEWAALRSYRELEARRLARA
ncbi:aspartyl/asparaginyl beta-hydroxylase domain-containing protein [Ramlibacter sp.]|uniref:aspartyl/asparaginyl beta-hydroxylase domain-containing protein n=1 Tax=Ramlibacter sp. TaxID=1917967 RepID=UPI00178F5E89|nr:aspartyl/asparaginyl beta-hydroxylase domain-containing protein [Ramlibacter sp.]MBA2672881.1 aspartyl/asparaginyl beta-hydroxylase domain-containing protein [Ramlibacter sp.]